MKLLITTLFFLSLIRAYSQDTTLSKKNLKRIFNENANGNLFNWNKSKWDNSTNESHKSDYSEWQTSNIDSAYYLLDTIKLFNYRYAYYNIKGGITKNWNFYKKNRIHMFEVKYSEPPIGTCEAGDFQVKIKLIEKKIFLFH